MKTGTTGLLDRRRKRRGFYLGHLEQRDTSSVFSEAYASGAWVHEPGQASRSGVGSEKSATTQVAEEIIRVTSKLGTKVFLDVGCGDWNWMRGIDRLPFRYIGVDVVSDVINKNRELESDGVEFHVLNAIDTPLPKSDFCLCREVLFHLSLTDARSVLRNIFTSSEYVAITTDQSLWFNSDIRTGDFRNINLQVAPFLLPKPLYWIADGAVRPHRGIGIWKATSKLGAVKMSDEL